MKKIPFKLGIADDIHWIHKKISTYVLTVFAVAPQVLPMLSPDVKEALPMWAKTGISLVAVTGIAHKLVKVKKNVGTPKP